MWEAGRGRKGQGTRWKVGEGSLSGRWFGIYRGTLFVEGREEEKERGELSEK